MRAGWLLAIVLAPLALGGWRSSEGATPRCTAADGANRGLVSRGGYELACGPGSAVVNFKGKTYRIKGSRCFISSRGARLYFGAQRFDATSHPPPRRDGLYLVVEPNRDRKVEVIDGGVDLAPGLGAAILGTAQATNGLRQGTFTIHAHLASGKTSRQPFTGSWDCG